MSIEKVIVFSKRKDYVGRLPNGKIVFIKTTAEFYPNNIPAIVKITEEKENYAFGVLLIAITKETLYGDPEIINTINNKYKIKEYHYKDKKDTILLLIEEKFLSGSYYYEYIDLKDFCTKFNEIKKIIDYNREVTKILEEVKRKKKELDENRETALLPEDWDFQKGEWKESGKKKIQKREEIMKLFYEKIQRLAYNIPEIVEVKAIEVKTLISCRRSEKRETTENFFKKKISYEDIIPNKYFSEHYTNLTQILKKYSIIITPDGEYIIKRFPIEIPAFTWSEMYGAEITCGIYGGDISNFQYWLFEVEDDKKPAFIVYPVVIAKSEEEAQKKAESLAEAIDTWILEVSVEHIAQNYWKVTWDTLDDGRYI